MIIRTNASHISKLSEIENTQPYASGWGRDGFAGEMKLECAWIWGYEEEGHLLGFIALRSVGGVAEIINMAVLPAHTGKGIGTGLLRHALAALKEQGAEKVTLEVAVENSKARRLYEKSGLCILGQRKDFYGLGKDALVMGVGL